MKLLTIVLIAVGLSMDAFSLAMLYGTEGIKRKYKIILSVIVGIFHFIMPLIGLTIGSYITSKLIFKTEILEGIILSLIAIEMLVSSFKEEKHNFLVSLPGFILFGTSVSIDSLTVGIGLGAITNNYILSSFVFSITSFIFTLLGLNFGNILNQKYGKISTIIGGIILLILGLSHIF